MSLVHTKCAVTTMFMPACQKNVQSCTKLFLFHFFLTFLNSDFYSVADTFVHTQVSHTILVMEGLCPRLKKSSAMHLSSHHQKCKPPRKLALLSNLKKKVFNKSTEKETLLTIGFSEWSKLFLEVVQAFSLRSLFAL